MFSPVDLDLGRGEDKNTAIGRQNPLSYKLSWGCRGISAVELGSIPSTAHETHNTSREGIQSIESGVAPE